MINKKQDKASFYFTHHNDNMISQNTTTGHSKTHCDVKVYSAFHIHNGKQHTVRYHIAAYILELYSIACHIFKSSENYAKDNIIPMFQLRDSTVQNLFQKQKNYPIFTHAKHTQIHSFSGILSTSVCFFFCFRQVFRCHCLSHCCFLTQSCTLPDPTAN